MTAIIEHCETTRARFIGIFQAEYSKRWNTALRLLVNCCAPFDKVAAEVNAGADPSSPDFVLPQPEFGNLLAATRWLFAIRNEWMIFQLDTPLPPDPDDMPLVEAALRFQTHAARDEEFRVCGVSKPTQLACVNLMREAILCSRRQALRSLEAATKARPAKAKRIYPEGPADGN